MSEFFKDAICSICGDKIISIPAKLHLYNPVICIDCAGTVLIENVVKIYELEESVVNE
jgi:DNA-directed RNA polymerase subunit RPC12/RpoP